MTTDQKQEEGKEDDAIRQRRKIPSKSELKRLIVMWKNVHEQTRRDDHERAGAAAPNDHRSVLTIVENLETLLRYLEQAAAVDDEQEMFVRQQLLQHQNRHQRQQQQHQHQQDSSIAKDYVEILPENNDNSKALSYLPPVVSAALAPASTMSAAEAPAATRATGPQQQQQHQQMAVDFSQDDESVLSQCLPQTNDFGVVGPLPPSHCRDNEDDDVDNDDDHLNNEVQDNSQSSYIVQRHCETSVHICGTQIPCQGVAERSSRTDQLKEGGESLSKDMDFEPSHKDDLEGSQEPQSPQRHHSNQYQQSWSKSYFYYPSPWESQFGLNANVDNSKIDDDDDCDGLGFSIDSRYLPQTCDIGGEDPVLAAPSKSQQQRQQLQHHNDEISSSASSSSPPPSRLSLSPHMQSQSPGEGGGEKVDDDDVEEQVTTEPSALTEAPSTAIKEVNARNDGDKETVDKSATCHQDDGDNTPSSLQPFVGNDHFHASTMSAFGGDNTMCSDHTPQSKGFSNHPSRSITPHSSTIEISTHPTTSQAQEPERIPKIIFDQSISNDELNLLRSLEDEGYLFLVHEDSFEDYVSSLYRLIKSQHDNTDSGNTSHHIEAHDDSFLFVGTTRLPNPFSKSEKEKVAMISVCERTYQFYLCRVLGCMVISSSDFSSDLEERRSEKHIVPDFRGILSKNQVWGDNVLYDQTLNSSENKWLQSAIWWDVPTLSPCRSSPRTSLHNVFAKLNILVVEDEDDNSSDEYLLRSQEQDYRLSRGLTKSQMETLCGLLGATIVQNINQSEMDSMAVPSTTGCAMSTIVLIPPTVEDTSSLVDSLITKQPKILVPGREDDHDFVIPVKTQDVDNGQNDDNTNRKPQQCFNEIQFLYNLWVIDAISAGILPPPEQYAVGPLTRRV